MLKSPLTSVLNRLPNKKIIDELQMEKIKTFFEKYNNFKIRDIKNVEKLEVTLKTAEIFDLEKLYLFTLEGASVVFKSKILDKGSHSGVNLFYFTVEISTVFPRIVSAETILFWNLECGNYSKEETIQGRKLLFSYFLEAESKLK